MRVLGVDPGLTRCGVGVVDVARSRQVSMVHVGVIRTAAQDALDARLLALHRELTALVQAHQPDAVAVERVFSQANRSTVMGTGQAAGVAILVAAQAGLPVALHTPTEVKAAVTGNGQADKQQVTMMITRILRLSQRPSPADAADALALAVCHAWRGTPHAVAGQALTPAQRAWATALAGRRR